MIMPSPENGGYILFDEMYELSFISISEHMCRARKRTRAKRLFLGWCVVLFSYLEMEDTLAADNVMGMLMEGRTGGWAFK